MKKLINYVFVFLAIGAMFAIYFMFVCYLSKWTNGWSNLVLSIFGIAILAYLIKPYKDKNTYFFISYFCENGTQGRIFIKCENYINIIKLEDLFTKEKGSNTVILYYRQITRKEYLKQTNESCLTEKQKE